MNLKRYRLNKIFKKFDIYKEQTITTYTQELLDRIGLKSRINKEMPTLIITSTPHGHKDIFDTQMCALTDWHIYKNTDKFQLANAKPKERRRIRRKMRKRNKLNQELINTIELDDWIGLKDETGRKYVIQVDK